MAKLVVLIATFLLVQICKADNPADYWSRVLPNTPMPEALRDYLTAGLVDNYKPASSVPGQNLPKFVVPSRWWYVYAATDDDVKRDSNGALFFLEKNLHPGFKINLTFAKTDGATYSFLPREAADELPFSSAQFDDILRRFSVQPGSYSAALVKRTLQDCESPANKGERRVCATSVESMVDFAVSALGTNRLRVLMTSMHRQEGGADRKVYTVLDGIEKATLRQDSVVCHIRSYPYAVFYCHSVPASRSYVVPMLSDADGNRVSAAATCHLDTSTWNPKHLGLQALHVQRGTVPVCHFLPQDHIVWVPVN